MQGGDQLKVFDTDFGKIGILICYDSEFPELARLLSEEDMQILFVPFGQILKQAICVSNIAPKRVPSKMNVM